MEEEKKNSQTASSHMETAACLYYFLIVSVRCLAELKPNVYRLFILQAPFLSSPGPSSYSIAIRWRVLG